MDKLESIIGISWTEMNQIILSKGLMLLISIAIIVIGFWLAKVMSKAAKKGMEKSKMDKGLTTFISSMLSAIIKVLVVITAMSQLGIQMTSFIAILGAAGLAIGMAFSGTLSNFAGGIMILVFKPFKVGDLIKAQGEEGVVNEIQIFNTFLHTTDNKVIILPNGPLANGNMVNYTREENRRVDLTYSIAFGDDFDTAKSIIQKIILEDNNILKNPSSFIGVTDLVNSSVQLTVRVWTPVATYWDVFFDMNEKVFTEFKKAGLHIPSEHFDVLSK